MTAVVEAPVRPYPRPAPATHHRNDSPLRHLPVPDTEPPVDHGNVTPAARPDPGQGVLSLLAAEATESDDSLFGPQLTPTYELPDPGRWGRQVTQLIVEVMAGHRPSAQLVRWTTDQVYRQVRRRALPLPTGRDRTRVITAADRPVIGGVRVSEPDDGVAEIAVVVHRRHRVQAMALRLEGRDHRWVVTALQCG